MAVLSGCRQTHPQICWKAECCFHSLTQHLLSHFLVLPMLLLAVLVQEEVRLVVEAMVDSVELHHGEESAPARCLEGGVHDKAVGWLLKNWALVMVVRYQLALPHPWSFPPQAAPGYHQQQHPTIPLSVSLVIQNLDVLPQDHLSGLLAPNESTFLGFCPLGSWCWSGLLRCLESTQESPCHNYQQPWHFVRALKPLAHEAQHHCWSSRCCPFQRHSSRDSQRTV